MAVVAAALASGNAAMCVQTLELIDTVDLPGLSAVIPACVACAIAHRTRVEQAAEGAGFDLERALCSLDLYQHTS